MAGEEDVAEIGVGDDVDILDEIPKQVGVDAEHATAATCAAVQ